MDFDCIFCFLQDIDKTDHIKPGKSAMYEVEVSNLMPEFSTGINYDQGGYKLQQKLTERNRNVGRTDDMTLIETLSNIRPAINATEVLRSYPMSALAQKQWSKYQMFVLLWLAVHLAMMVMYTVESQRMVWDLRNVERTILNTTTNLTETVRGGELQATLADVLVFIFALAVFLAMLIPVIYDYTQRHVSTFFYK